ncbi:hypothetical protein [Chitinasiproducens palmae]|uniref:hypothetical protein n=1 Tax=Chitinasiproducens palmae TaxID=1770053 RepID=UPI0011133C39|nr:hypothetical protein [Chitinasiproducens palmae]
MIVLIGAIGLSGLSDEGRAPGSAVPPRCVFNPERVIDASTGITTIERVRYDAKVAPLLV